MKRNLGFIIAGFIIIIILFFVFSNNRNKNDFTLSVPVTYCFLRNVNDYDGKDIAYIKAELQTDNTVKGVLNISYLDEYRIGGEFFGRWEGDGQEFTMNVLHGYTLQGAPRYEQRIIKFDPEYAYIGHGALTEKDGIMYYSNLDNLTFYDMLLPRPCEEIPVSAKEII